MSAAVTLALLFFCFTKLFVPYTNLCVACFIEMLIFLYFSSLTVFQRLELLNYTLGLWGVLGSNTINITQTLFVVNYKCKTFI